MPSSPLAPASATESMVALSCLCCKTAEHSLGTASGHAENHTGAGTEAERHVAGFRNKSGEFNAGITDHTDHLCGGDDYVSILFAFGITVWTEDLHFLGRTGHDGTLQRSSCPGSFHNLCNILS